MLNRNMLVILLGMLSCYFMKVVKQQATVHRCNAFFYSKEEEHPPYPATVNDDSLHLLVQRVGKSLIGQQNVGVAKKVMTGEDFALFYKRLIPEVMLRIGIRNEEKGSAHYPHSPHFFLGADVLPIVEWHCTLIL